jgi:hypothetical protein
MVADKRIVDKKIEDGLERLKIRFEDVVHSIGLDL